MDPKTIRKIINEMFEQYHSPEIEEPVIKKFLKKYGIEDEEEVWKFLVKAEDLGLITICASTRKYGEISIVKGDLRNWGKVIFKI